MTSLPLEFLERIKEQLDEDYEFYLNSFNEDKVRAFILNPLGNVEKFKQHFPLPFSKIDYYENGYYLNSNEKIGNSVFHKIGAIYMQEPSAMYPVSVLPENKTNIKILDMCSAPGGKTIQLALKYPNATIVSNEINKARCNILISNIERMGLTNVLVTNLSTDKLTLYFQNYFDIIVCDAPCSGEGMFRKDEDAIKMWNPELVKMCAKRQSEILENANICLKENGLLLYSTCTYSTEEDELQVLEFKNKHKYSILPVLTNNLISGKYKDNKEIENTKKCFPHKIKGEGQFFALLKKEENNNFLQKNTIKIKENYKNISICLDFLKNTLQNIDFDVIEKRGFFYAIKDKSILSNFDNFESFGVKLGEVQKDRFIPHHNLFTAYGKYFKNAISLEPNSPQILKYLHGEELTCETDKNGFGVIITCGYTVGGFKQVGNKLKNLYPKGLRI